MTTFDERQEARNNWFDDMSVHNDPSCELVIERVTDFKGTILEVDLTCEACREVVNVMWSLDDDE